MVWLGWTFKKSCHTYLIHAKLELKEKVVLLCQVFELAHEILIVACGAQIMLHVCACNC